MKRIFELLCCCSLSVISFAQIDTAIAIIPEPVNIIRNPGQFLLPQNVVISAGTQPEIKEAIAFLKERLSVPTGMHVTVSNVSPTATIRLLLNKTADATI